MNSAANESQHKCSCGRTFRHGISLKRHQKVSGCAELEVSAEVAAPAPTVKAPAVRAIDKDDEDNSGSVVITAAQIARWQEQKNPRAAAPVVATPAFSIDWAGVKGTCLEFVSFTGEQFGIVGRFCASMVQLGARFTLFGAFVLGLGWLCLFGISKGLSAAPAGAVNHVEAAEMAARSTVNSFLQTAQLNQYDRARNFLSNKTRETVSSNDLEKMFTSLPINVAPQDVRSTLEQDGRVAKVTVVRAGNAEVYTLVQEQQGWGLASVSVRRS